MRIIGIDFGEARTGIAMSDPMGWTAQGVCTVSERNPEKVAEKVCEIIKEYKAEKAVLGLPRNMDGSEGFRAEATRKFAEILKTKTDIEIVFWDERLSTVSAQRTLNETGFNPKKKRSVIDTVAATYILQGFLDKK